MNRRNSFSSATSDSSASSRVSFSDTVSTKCIKPLEKAVAWYSVHELKEIRRDATLAVSVMRSTTITQDTDAICTHGLDSQVNKQLALARKELARSAVFYEQDYQIQNYHDVNDERLANVYFEVTHFNQLSASRRGRKHAKAVQSMWTKGHTEDGLQHRTKNVLSF